MKPFLFMKNEIWKDIPDYEGLYQISSIGRVKSLKRSISRNNGRVLNLSEKQLSAKIDEHGYVKFQLWKNNKPKNIRAHRLVALNFIENPKNHLEVNHIDGNKTNNKYDNLEWCSSFHNQLEAKRLGLKKCTRVTKIIEGVKICSYESVTEAAKLNNVHRTSIFRCLNGKFKENKGVKWVYEKK